VCRERWQRLEREHEKLHQHLAEKQPASMFATSAPRPDRTDRVTAWIRTALARPTGPLPMSVECRGPLCRLVPAAGEDPLAIKWHCREATAGLAALCLPRPGGGDWFDVLTNKLPDRVGKMWPPPLRDPVDGKVRPAFLILRASDERPSPWLASLAFLDAFDWRAAARACEAQFPERGKLELRLDVPETAGDERPPNRIVLHVGGALGGTRLARCISGAFEAASARFTVLATEGSVLHGELGFPFDASALEKKLQLRREQAKADQPQSGL
jgi:hypothetical protein